MIELRHERRDFALGHAGVVGRRLGIRFPGAEERAPAPRDEEQIPAGRCARAERFFAGLAPRHEIHRLQQRHAGRDAERREQTIDRGAGRVDRHGRGDLDRPARLAVSGSHTRHAPPVGNCSERFDVVEPIVRNEHRIARRQLGLLRHFQSIGETWIPLQVGGGHVDHAYRRSGGSRVRRTHVQILFGLRREEREAAPSGDHHCDIVDRIIVCRDLGCISDPQPGLGLVRNQRHGVGGLKAGDVVIGNQPLHDHRKGPLRRRLLPEHGKKNRQACPPPKEIQRKAFVSVVKPPHFRRVSAKDFDRFVGRMSRQNRHAANRVAARLGNQRPTTHNSAQDSRQAARHNLLAELLRRRGVPLLDLAHNCRTQPPSVREDKVQHA